MSLLPLKSFASQLQLWNLKPHSSIFASTNQMKLFLVRSNYQNILWSWKWSHQDYESHGAKRAHKISLGWLSTKVCGCYSITSLNRTPIFGCCVVYRRSKNKHHKHTCHERDQSTSSNKLDSILYTQDWTQLRGPMYSVKKPTFVRFQQP